jgi:hypothetical protein
MAAARRLAVAAAATFSAAAAGAAAWLAPVYPAAASHTSEPPPPSPLLCAVRDGQPPARHPGVTATPDFLSPRERRALLAEVSPLLKRYGIDLISPLHAAMYRFQQSYLPAPPPPVNMLRVTGRPEHAAQTRPPWGYGDAFDASALPPTLAALAGRVTAAAAERGVRLGPLRDVTLNKRRGFFYRLDPHIDPAADGEHVFIVGLDADTVLTLSPARLQAAASAADAAASALGFGDERDALRRSAEASWTRWDLDVLAAAGTLVHLCGPARWSWTHATRLGCPLPPDSSGGPPAQPRGALHDWFGNRESVVLRSPERHSIVLAFAAAGE